jgi:hypothetical protein
VSSQRKARRPSSSARLGIGSLALQVDKYHSLIFDAGREVDVMPLPDGRDFVQVITATPQGGGLLQPKRVPSGAAGFHLPDDWVLRSEKLMARITIHLPNPTQAWFFKNGASFQGPVDTFAS